MMDEKLKTAELIEIDGEYVSVEKAIAAAKSFEELFSVLDKLGPVQGSAQIYTPEQTKNIIRDYRAGVPGAFCTRTFGIRDAVTRLHNEEEAKAQASQPPPSVEERPGHLDITEEERAATEAISATKSFKELFETLDRLGSIKNSYGESLSAQRLKIMINQMRGQYFGGTGGITRTHGLRDKALQLIKAEQEQQLGTPIRSYKDLTPVASNNTPDNGNEKKTADDAATDRLHTGADFPATDDVPIDISLEAQNRIAKLFAPLPEEALLPTEVAIDDMNHEQIESMLNDRITTFASELAYLDEKAAQRGFSLAGLSNYETLLLFQKRLEEIKNLILDGLREQDKNVKQHLLMSRTKVFRNVLTNARPLMRDLDEMIDGIPDTGTEQSKAPPQKTGWWDKSYREGQLANTQKEISEEPDSAENGGVKTEPDPVLADTGSVGENNEAKKPKKKTYSSNAEYGLVMAQAKEIRGRLSALRSSYEEQHKIYYEMLAKRGQFERLFNRAPKDLPEDLKSIKEKYEAAQRDYALVLEKWATIRRQAAGAEKSSLAVEANESSADDTPSLSSDKKPLTPLRTKLEHVRAGIYQRYIVKTGEFELAAQREALGFWSPETRADAQKISETLRKYRTHRIGLTGAAIAIGVGVFTPAGTVAGLWAGGSYTLRAIASIVGGAAGGALFGNYLRTYVEEGYNHVFTEKRRNALKDFEKEAKATDNASSLLELKQSYLKTKGALEKSEQRKRAVGRGVVIGGALLGGGASAVLAGEVTARENLSESTASASGEQSNMNSGGALNGSESRPSRQLTYEQADRILGGFAVGGQLPQEQESLGPGSPVVEEAPVVPDGEPELPHSLTFESIQLPNQITITHYSVDGELYGRSRVSGIELVGPQLSETSLPEQREIIEAWMSEKINDLLDAHPHMRAEDLGVALQAKLAERFGNESWWANHPIQQVRVGEIEFVRYGPDGQPVVPAPIERAPESEPPPAPVPESPAEVTHTVQRGDTLWGILKQHYANELQGLSRQEQNRVLDAVFDKARVDTALRDSIGLRSGDVDLIYPREQLNVTDLGEELKRQIELLREPDLVQRFPHAVSEGLAETESLVVPLKTDGKLAIVADNAEKNISIKTPFSEMGAPKSESVSVTMGGAEVAVERAPEAPRASGQVKEIKPPAFNSTSGFQFRDPSYLAFVTEKFGSLRQFDRIFEGVVMSVEKPTWGLLDRILGDTPPSPLTKIGTMTLAEVEQFYDRSYDAIVAELNKDGIRYEAFREWMRRLPEMKQAVSHHPNTLFNDLVARYVAETHLKAK